MSGFWVECLRPGQAKDTKGRVHNFTAEFLEKEIAGCYDPAKYEAPAVIGHPKTDDPAWGWVTKPLRRRGDVFEAFVDRPVAEFADAVAKGLYRKVSAKIEPGRRGIVHIGFLGAVPPAVHGLKPVDLPQFAEDDDASIVIELAEPAIRLSATARVLRRIRDWLIEKEGVERADQVISSWDLEVIEDDESRGLPAFAEQEDDVTTKTKPETPAGGAPAPAPAAAEPTQAEFAERDQKIEELERRLAEADARERKADRDAWLKTVVGRKLPAGAEAFAAQFMEALDTPGTATFEFAEGDETKQFDLLDGLKRFVDSYPDLAEFSELAGEETAPKTRKVTAAEFAAPVSEADLDFHNEVLAYQESHEGTSFRDAADAVLRTKR